VTIRYSGTLPHRLAGLDSHVAPGNPRLSAPRPSDDHIVDVLPQAAMLPQINHDGGFLSLGVNESRNRGRPVIGDVASYDSWLPCPPKWGTHWCSNNLMSPIRAHALAPCPL